MAAFFVNHSVTASSTQSVVDSQQTPRAADTRKEATKYHTNYADVLDRIRPSGGKTAQSAPKAVSSELVSNEYVSSKEPTERVLWSDVYLINAPDTILDVDEGQSSFLAQTTNGAFNRTSGIQRGMVFAVKANEGLLTEDTLAMSTYPESLMQEYKNLMRFQRIGRLTVRQQKRLEEVRHGIQKISRADEKSQKAARDVHEINHSLAELEERVDAAILQKKSDFSKSHSV